MPTVNLGDPGFFDTMVQKENATELARRYGAGQGTLGLDTQTTGTVARDRGLGAQYDALGMYRDAATGNGPSVAQMQMQQGLGNAQRATLQAAAAGRGGNLAGQQQAALNAGAGLQSNVNTQGAMLRAQEQQAAQQAYAGLGAQLAGQGFAYDQLNAQTQLQQDQNALGWYSAQRGMDMQQAQNSWDRAMGLWQAGAGVIGGGLAGASKMSDERAKLGIMPSDGTISQSAAAAVPVTFGYKPGLGDGPGLHGGFTAQNLERTPLGPSLVRNTPQGKMVDTGNASMAALAGVGELRQELDAMKQASVRQYAPDEDIDFGSRVTAARNSPRARVVHEMAQASRRADAPLSGRLGLGGRTIDPFEEGEEMYADGSTISQQYTRNDRGLG